MYTLINIAGGKVMRVGQIFRDNIYSCGYCRGTGNDLRTRSICHICKGTGKVDIKGSVVVCAFCRGTGKGHTGSSVTCSVCNGKGVVNVKEPVKACPECRGSGKTSSGLSCLRCRGKGVLEGQEE